jgi:predicted kinase
VVIIVIGLPGSGKSYFASRLADMLGAIYINSDQVRKQMLSKKTYSEKEKLSVYDAMMEKMKVTLEQKKDVVLDATFYKRTIRSKFLDELKGKVESVIIEVKASIPLTRERLEIQRPDSDADFEVYKTIKKQWEPLEGEHLILPSTNDNITDMLQKASDYLKFKDDKRANR